MGNFSKSNKMLNIPFNKIPILILLLKSLQTSLLHVISLTCMVIKTETLCSCCDVFLLIRRSGNKPVGNESCRTAAEKSKAKNKRTPVLWVESNLLLFIYMLFFSQFVYVVLFTSLNTQRLKLFFLLMNNFDMPLSLSLSLSDFRCKYHNIPPLC